jgi:hypothetical protein
MNRPTQMGGLVLAGLAGVAQPGAADPRPSLSIALNVCDDWSIPPMSSVEQKPK